MKIMIILSAVIAVVLGGAVWYFHESAASAERERDD